MLISKLVVSVYRPLILKWKRISELFTGMIHFAVYIPETVTQHENIDLLLGKRVKDQVKIYWLLPFFGKTGNIDTILDYLKAIINLKGNLDYF